MGCFSAVVIYMLLIKELRLREVKIAKVQPHRASQEPSPSAEKTSPEFPSESELSFALSVAAVWDLREQVGLKHCYEADSLFLQVSFSLRFNFHLMTCLVELDIGLEYYFIYDKYIPQGYTKYVDPDTGQESKNIRAFQVSLLNQWL